jgi:CP family cyanate transporter-like MFS transporter
MTTPSRRRSALAVGGPAVALVLASLCLRGPFASVGPLLGDLGRQLAVPGAVLAVLTSLPLLSFAATSPLAPALAERLGLHRAVVAGAGLLVAGIALRSAGVVGLFAGTVVLSAGIAIINVLLPGITRREYAHRGHVVIGATTAGIAVSASIGAGLAHPLADATGGPRAALALWALPALLALAGLAALARARRRDTPRVAAAARPPLHRMLRDPVARPVIVFFGLQSLAFYTMLTWLPGFLEDRAGLSATAAGGLLAVAALLGAPSSLVVPGLAGRRPSQRGWVLAVSLPTVAAVAGLLLAPAAAPVLWAVLYGIGNGASFPLAMALILVRTRDVVQTGQLSAVAQSAGYLVAAGGPLAVGLLHDATGGWTVGLVVMLVLLGVQVAVGLAAARPRLVAAGAPAPQSSDAAA